jgi:hypothetical protein
MNRNSTYPSLLGEFAALKNVVGGWFHQDAYLDAGSDEEIWADILALHDTQERKLLISQLAALLQQSDNFIVSFWNSIAHSHSFANGDEARRFLGSMLSYFMGNEGVS